MWWSPPSHGAGPHTTKFVASCWLNGKDGLGSEERWFVGCCGVSFGLFRREWGINYGFEREIDGWRRWVCSSFEAMRGAVLAVSRWRNRCWKEEMKETIGEGRQIWEWEEQPREQSEEDVLCSLVFFFFLRLNGSAPMRERKEACVQRASMLFGQLRGRRKAKGKTLELGRRECWCCGRVYVGLCWWQGKKCRGALVGWKEKEKLPWTAALFFSKKGVQPVD